MLETYTEVETSRRADRPELARAPADGTRSRATLVIARSLPTPIEGGAGGASCDPPDVSPGAVGKLIPTRMAAVGTVKSMYRSRNPGPGGEK